MQLLPLPWNASYHIPYEEQQKVLVGCPLSWTWLVLLHELEAHLESGSFILDRAHVDILQYTTLVP